MRNIKIFSLILGLILSIQIYAQQSDSLRFMRSPFKSTYLVFSPLNLLEIEPSLQLGVEYSASSRLRIQHELGYVGIFNPAYYIFSWNGTNLQSTGMRFRTMLKFPLKLDNENVRHRHKYLGVDFMFKYLKVYDPEYEVRRFSSFWQTMAVNTEKYVGAVHFVFGFKEFLSYSNNIVTDWYIGLGTRYKYVTDDTPSDVTYDYTWYDELQGMNISVMMGFKLSFGL